MEKKMITVGIDFGTSNTVISYYKKNPIIFKDSVKDFVPTKIYFGDDIKCGNYIPIDVDEKNKNLLSNFKVKIGSNFSFNSNNKIYSEFEILVIFFNHLKNILLKSFPNSLFNVVLTVPSNFNDNQRQILMNVSKKVGFNILRIINEPTSAAFAYGITNEMAEEKILVFDLGGGTLDITILEVDESFFETIDSVGVNDLGGNNFTDVIYDDCLKEFKKINRCDDMLISKNKLVQLWYKCNKAKEKLLWVDSCNISIDNFYSKDNLKIKLNYNLDRIKFKQLTSDILDRIIRKIDLLSKDHQLDKIIMVGGSSKLKLVQELIEEVFKIKPMIHSQLQNVVSLGACYYGALIQKELSNNEIILVDNLPLSLGIETAEGSFSAIIPKNTPLPASRSKKYTIDTPGEDNVFVKVYQGERSIANKNFLIGEFEFNKISKVNMPVINITFKVDINGLINVSIEDKHSGSSKDILIRNNVDVEGNLDDILKIASDNKELDDKESIKNQFIYKLEIRIEQILNNVNNNNLIKNELKKNISNELVEYLDDLNSKTIQELMKLDKKLDDEFFSLSQTKLDDPIDELEETHLNIEDTILNEKKDFLKARIDFYFTKNVTDFQRECLKKITISLDEDNNDELDEKINYLKELFKENDRDELLQLCFFLKEELENFNLEIDENQYDILSKIVEKYLNMLNNTECNINYKEEINNLNDICRKLIENK